MLPDAQGGDSVLRAIEDRAATIVGCAADTVEPLQVVAYEEKQYFELHHDVGPLAADGTVEIVPPRRLYIPTYIYMHTGTHAYLGM